MEPTTALVLGIQLFALFSIAGGLLLYLLCKVRGTRESLIGQKGGSILVTSADTALGLQLCTHLAARGCRVFAGMKDPVESLPAKLLRGWLKMKENLDQPIEGSIVPLRLDVTREDVLKEATEAMGAHLNAGERGILAVINTAGIVHRGRIENQDSLQWETMFKTNVLGSLRTARAFTGLLKPTRGRLIYFGAGNEGDGLVAYTASRSAVDGCADALRMELQPFGISVIALDSHGVPAESLYRSPIPFHATDNADAPTQYSAEVLTQRALGVIENALWDVCPNERYHLAVPYSKFSITKPCGSMYKKANKGRTVQKV
ncbi:3 beta-hydroxysteroid dehydrogenase dhs-16 [Bradysia coprophila]|uniref:3 beta-hydroxysteroid dehydrogenase dhs-16 n=1 Tax=Bradysia coprophila TaxID=38358 RepID=UPI00187DD1D3|nr:3 beta-hydroxysteroid dehydrogenase dhs-16 [Bradysia coprophila]XP_037038374.1 3 beta-hydroxysteroid dehydrogenase dhs-16 [Bradysia coprophila]